MAFALSTIVRTGLTCVELTMLVLFAPGAQCVFGQEEAGFHALFNGETVTGWTAYDTRSEPLGWKVDDAALYRSAGGGDLMSVDQFGDFDFRFEWKIAAGGNSGVMYRVKRTDQPAYVTGPEYQILDDAGHADGKRDVTSAASIYGLYAPTVRKVKPAGQWNEGRIVVRGNHIQHWLNGSLVVDATIGSPDWNDRIRGGKFSEWEQFAKMPQGHIVLQDHGDPVWYRKLRIQSL